MFVCICKAITDTQIRNSVINGSNTLKDVRDDLGVATQCCKCVSMARTVINEVKSLSTLSNKASSLPLFYSA